VDAVARQAANEEAVRNFFAAWDPAWRWILILGMRQLRDNPVALGALASAEADGHESWAEGSYAYGPLSLGITAAAVNEAAQHCEDLFALLRFLREPAYFAREMANYSAGKVVEFGRKLVDADETTISRLFLVPEPATVRAGLAEAADPQAFTAAVEVGRARLGAMVRETAAFYRANEDFHVQYKHGLKLPLSPFGVPTKEAIEERKANLKAPLFSYTSEPISAMLRRPQSEQVMMLRLGPNQKANLSKLIEERNVLRLRLAHDVDLDEVVRRSYTVLRLLQLAQTNRLALGQVADGNQSFTVPGEGKWEQVDVLVKLDRVLSLKDFAEPRPARDGSGKRRGGTRSAERPA
jgi:hypothetical protein